MKSSFFNFITSKRESSAVRAFAFMLACIFNLQAHGNIDSLKLLADKLATKDFAASISICNKGIEATNIDDHKAVFYRIQGKAYYFKGDFDAASVLFSKAINIFEAGRNKKELGLTFIEQAKLYRKTNMLFAAERTYDRALNIFTELKDTANIATVFNESGVVYEYRKEYEKALQRYTRSLELKRILRDTIGMAYSYNFISGLYLLQDKILMAEQNALQSLSMFAAKNDSFAVALTYSDLAKICSAGNKLSDAKRYVSLSNDFANRAGYDDLLTNNYKITAGIFEKQGKRDSAFFAIKSYAQLKDSLFNISIQEKIIELNTKYETAQKDKEILQKKSEVRLKNMQLIAGTGGVLLLSLLFFSTYKSSKLKHRTELQEVIIQQQDIATKSIVAAEESERQRMSATLHDGLGQLLSAAKMNMQAIETKAKEDDKTLKSYQKILSLLDDSIKEMRSVSHQMMPGAFMRFGLGAALKELIEKIDTNTLEVNLNVDGLNENYDSNIEIVLYRIFQECVNNVIKHAKATKLFISLSQTDNYIDATIEDNGIGFDLKDTQGKGIGLENIKTRINFLKGILDVNTAKGKGTLIAFHIPIKPEQ